MSKDLNTLIKEYDKKIHEECQIDDPSEYKYVDYMNRFKLKFPSHELERAVGYIFFTKPDLNILDDTGKVRDQAAALYSLRDIMRSRDIAYVQSLKMNYGPTFINLLSSYATNIDVVDVEMKPRTTSETSTNWKIMYGFRTSESRAANSLSINYGDDRNLAVYKTHKIWIEYINAVSLGLIDPKREYILKRVLDYAASIYYFLVSEDGETIIYYAKFTGVFPTNVPDSAYSWAEGDESKNRNYQIHYQYSFYEPMNPMIINDFNKLNGSVNNMKKIEIHDTHINQMGPTWARKAHIAEYKEHGVFKGYKLQFYQ